MVRHCVFSAFFFPRRTGKHTVQGTCCSSHAPHAGRKIAQLSEQLNKALKQADGVLQTLVHEDGGRIYRPAFRIAMAIAMTLDVAVHKLAAVTRTILSGVGINVTALTLPSPTTFKRWRLSLASLGMVHIASIIAIDAMPGTFLVIQLDHGTRRSRHVMYTLFWYVDKCGQSRVLHLGALRLPGGKTAEVWTRSA